MLLLARRALVRIRSSGNGKQFGKLPEDSRSVRSSGIGKHRKAAGRSRKQSVRYRKAAGQVARSSGIGKQVASKAVVSRFRAQHPVVEARGNAPRLVVGRCSAPRPVVGTPRAAALHVWSSATAVRRLTRRPSIWRTVDAHPRSREEAEEARERGANAARQEVYREVATSRVSRAAALEYVVHVALVETHDDRQAVAETVEVLRRVQQVVPVVGESPQIE